MMLFSCLTTVGIDLEIPLKVHLCSQSWKTFQMKTDLQGLICQEILGITQVICWLKVL